MDIPDAGGSGDAAAARADGQDSGLASLVLLLRFHGIAADAGQIGHRLGGVTAGIPEMLRCAKDFGLKARAVTRNGPQLAKIPLPAIAERADGGFLILGKLADDKVLVQDPHAGRPPGADDPARQSGRVGPAFRRHLIRRTLGDAIDVYGEARHQRSLY